MPSAELSLFSHLTLEKEVSHKRRGWGRSQAPSNSPNLGCYASLCPHVHPWREILTTLRMPNSWLSECERPENEPTTPSCSPKHASVTHFTLAPKAYLGKTVAVPHSRAPRKTQLESPCKTEARDGPSGHYSPNDPPRPSSKVFVVLFLFFQNRVFLWNSPAVLELSL